MTTDKDIAVAAQLWCRKQHENKEMDVRLCQDIADEIAKARKEGFKEGAEAMRERAAKEAENYSYTHQSWTLTQVGIAEVIRALHTDAEAK